MRRLEIKNVIIKKTCHRRIENQVEDISQNVDLQDMKMENIRGKTQMISLIHIP